jgi:hypothetical protein
MRWRSALPLTGGVLALDQISSEPFLDQSRQLQQAARPPSHLVWVLVLTVRRVPLNYFGFYLEFPSTSVSAYSQGHEIGGVRRGWTGHSEQVTVSFPHVQIRQPKTIG